MNKKIQRYSDLNPQRKSTLGFPGSCSTSYIIQRWSTQEGRQRFLDFVNHYVKTEMKLISTPNLQWSQEIEDQFYKTIGAATTKEDVDVLQGAYHMSQILANRTRMSQRLSQCANAKIPQMNWTNVDHNN